jgi:uncharacterized Fe-S radical SAM superfamily protein PflX
VSVIEACAICPRKCSAYRDEIGGKGFCHAGTLPKIARIEIHK